ncbi:MAG: tetratricopeptide repeat protein [Candidatus Kryptoniota bacterium]
MNESVQPILIIMIAAALLSLDSSITYAQAAGETIAEQQDYTFAVGLYRNGQYQLALQQFDSFLKHYPSSSHSDEIIFLSGESLMQLKQYSQAILKYTLLMDSFPESPYFIRAELRAGEIYLKIGHLEKAEKFLKNVLSSGATQRESGVEAEASFKLGQVFVEKADYDNAIKYFELTYEGYPQSQFADYALYAAAWSYGKKGNFSVSRAKFIQLLKQYPESSLKDATLEKIGECSYFLGDYKSSADTLSKLTISVSKERALSENGIQIFEPALYFLGRDYAQLQIIDSAITTYEKYIEFYPEGSHNSEVRVFLSNLILEKGKGDLSKVIKLLGPIESGDPLFSDAQISLAKAYQAIGRFDSTEKIMQSLIAGSKGSAEAAKANLEFGKMLYKEKMYEKAQSTFVEASRDESIYPAAMKNAAVSAAAHGDYQNAKVYFLNAIGKLTGHSLVTAHFEYASALYASGDFKGAAQVYLAIQNISYASNEEREKALYLEGESFFRAGDYQQAANIYSDYISAYQTGNYAETALLGLGYSLYYQSRFVDAIKDFKAFVFRYPASIYLPDVYLRMGDSFYFNRNYDSALAVYREAAMKFSSDTTTAYAWYQIGQSEFNLQSYDSSLTAFQHVIKNFPATSIAAEAQYAIGWVYFSEKNYKEAIIEFNHTLKNYPQSTAASRALYSRGDAYYNMGSYNQALQSYNELLEKYPTSQYVDNAIVGMQYCLTILGRPKEAEQVIDNFVSQHPGLPHVDQIFYKKVDYALNQNRLADAEKDLKEFVIKFPESSLLPKALYNLANVYIKLKNESSAMGVFSDIIRKYRKSEYATAARIELAEIYQRKKSYIEAQKLLVEAAAGNDSYTTKAETALGRLYLAEGDTLRAESELSKAALSQSDSINDGDRASAKILLGEIYANTGRLEEAISLANSVARSRTDIIGGEAQLNVARYYCMAGDSSNAILGFLRVKYVFGSFEDLVARSELEMADCLTKFGNVSDARHLLDDFLKEHRNDRYARIAMDKLRKIKSQ